MISGKRKVLLASLVFGLLMGTGAEASTYTLQGITVNGDRVNYDSSVSSEEQAKWLPGGYERQESYLGLSGDTPFRGYACHETALPGVQFHCQSHGPDGTGQWVH